MGKVRCVMNETRTMLQQEEPLEIEYPVRRSTLSPQSIAEQDETL